MPIAEHRYAEALIEISMQNGLMNEYRKELRDILSIYKTENDFRLFLLNPGIKTDIKKDLAAKVFGGRIKTELLHFLLLLLDRKRIDLLNGIFLEYCSLADKLGNILKIEVISAEPLDDSQVNRIEDIYRKEYGASGVKAEIKTDPSLIGGVMVKIGDRLIDGTVRGRLAQLKESVMEA